MRFNKMNELAEKYIDKNYLKRTQDSISYCSTNLIQLEDQIKQERIKFRKLQKEFMANNNKLELYSKIRRHKKVAMISVVGDRLHVVTKKILNSKVDFGKYRIEIGLGTGVYKVSNLTYRFNGNGDLIPHPHIRNGEICLGDYRDGLYAYDKQGNLYLVVDTLIHFLELAKGTRDAYVERSRWIEERTKIKPEPK